MHLLIMHSRLLECWAILGASTAVLKCRIVCWCTVSHQTKVVFLQPKILRPSCRVPNSVLMRVYPEQATHAASSHGASLSRRLQEDRVRLSSSRSASRPNFGHTSPMGPEFVQTCGQHPVAECCDPSGRLMWEACACWTMAPRHGSLVCLNQTSASHPCASRPSWPSSLSQSIPGVQRARPTGLLFW